MAARALDRHIPVRDCLEPLRRDLEPVSFSPYDTMKGVFCICITREQRLLAGRNRPEERMRDANEIEIEFAASIGIDWGEQKHACALQSATTSGVEESELLH